MKAMRYSGDIEVIAVCLEPGEPLLESIRAVIKQHDIQNGVVVSGVATLKKCRMHYINHTDFPPKDTFYEVEKPLEVGSISGMIADYEPHLHIVIGCKDDKTWTGHLEEGSIVGYLAEICILKFNGLQMSRKPDEKRKVKMLGPKTENP